MKKSDKIGFYIIAPIIAVVFIIFGIKESNSKYIYASIALIAVVILNLVLDRSMNTGNNKTNKIVKKLKKKLNRTLFEDLYIASTNNSLKARIENRVNKLKQVIKDLDVYPAYKADSIIIDYTYKDFLVSFQIGEEKIVYSYIVADKYYDYSEFDQVIEDFEKEKEIFNYLIEFDSIDSLLDYLDIQIESSNKEINNFISSNVIDETNDYMVKSIALNSGKGYLPRFIIGFILFIISFIFNIYFSYIGYDKYIVDSGIDSTLVLLPTLIIVISGSVAIYISQSYENKEILNRNLRLQKLTVIIFSIYYISCIVCLIVFRFNTVGSIISLLGVTFGLVVLMFGYLSKSSMISWNSLSYDAIFTRLIKNKFVLENEIILTNKESRYCLETKNQKMYFVDRKNSFFMVLKLLKYGLKEKLIKNGESKFFFVKSKIDNLILICNKKQIKIVKNNKIYSLKHTLSK